VPKPVTVFGAYDFISTNKIWRVIGASFAILIDVDESADSGGKVTGVAVHEAAEEKTLGPDKKWIVLEDKSSKETPSIKKIKPPDYTSWFGRLTDSNLCIGMKKDSKNRTIVHFDSPHFAIPNGSISQRKIDARIEIHDEKGNVRNITYSFTIGVNEEKPTGSSVFSITEPKEKK
jgi:hypothetical protein